MTTSKPSAVYSEELIQLAKFGESLTNIEKIINPILAQPLDELHEKLQPIDRAKLDLTLAFVLNSSFWMYLKTIGEDPEEHNVNYGLERIRNYMKTVEEMIAKEDAPRLDKEAAKRFVRSSLWTAKSSQEATGSEESPKNRKSKFKNKIQKSSNALQSKKPKNQFKKGNKQKRK